jgi:hypothetical protein
VAAEDADDERWMMGNRDESRPEGPVDARRWVDAGDGDADDDVSGHGMPEIPDAGDGFMAVPRLPRRDGLAGDTGDDVEGHGMPEIPDAGDGFMAVPRLPRRDGLTGDTGDDVEGHAFLVRAAGQADDDTGEQADSSDEASPA